MGMKGLIKGALFLSILMTCFIFTSCGKTMKPDTPLNVGMLMKLAIDFDDYEGFNNLFSQGRKGVISEELFSEMKNITTSVAGHTHYQLLTFENDEMLLVRLTPEKVKGEYKIEDVTIVASDAKEIFK